MLIDTWKRKAKQLKREIHTVYLAMKDPRTPWYARVLAAIIVGYAFSPKNSQKVMAKSPLLVYISIGWIDRKRRFCRDSLYHKNN